LLNFIDLIRIIQNQNKGFEVINISNMEPDLTVSIRHEYSDVNVDRDIAELDYENKEIEWG
jgi:hypothetical protein